VGTGVRDRGASVREDDGVLEPLRPRGIGLRGREPGEALGDVRVAFGVPDNALSLAKEAAVSTDGPP
jgi:hypothetical protein